MSKQDSLNQIAPNYKPLSFRFEAGVELAEVLDQLRLAKLSFPVIGKPDIGERGAEVDLLHNEEELENWLARQRYEPVIQEFVGSDLEFGILYYRHPFGHESGITSVVIKEFLSVTGDGQSTLYDLIQDNDRARLRLDYLYEKFADRLNEVLPAGEALRLEPIGNHSRGTVFLDGNYLINDQLVRVFDEISADMEGFNYGRFDLKVTNLEDLYQGRNIRILEVNGVNSEPAHIYQPRYNWLKAYRSIMQHMYLIYRIGKANHQLGVPYDSFTEMMVAFKHHILPATGPEPKNEPVADIPIQEVV